MKKFILCLLCVSYLGFSQDKEAVSISLMLQEEEAIAPDLLKMDIYISARGNKEIEVINRLGEIDKDIKKLGFDYSGGSYSVEKNCWWEWAKRKCKGYLGELSYSFRLQKASDQNRILDVLDTFKEKFGEGIDYKVYEPHWVVSEKKTKGLEEELRLRLLDRAKEFAKKAGQRLGMECRIQSVNYERHDIPIRGLMLKSSSEAPEPKAEEKTLSVRALVGFVCR
ncbi:MAG: SIMPL domain-containing protein [Aquificaceae bacterium]